MSLPCRPWRCAVRLRRYQDVIARNVEWLEETQIKNGPPDRKGGWSYPAPAGWSVAGDASNSQFALLALYEAGRAAEADPVHIHVTIRRETWERVRNYWINNQTTNDGAWGYTSSGRHRQHDLCGHRLAGDRRRRAARARRQGDRRPDRRLLSGLLGRPGPDRPRPGLAGEALHRPGQSALVAPSAASGITIISTGWSVPDGSPRGKIGEYDWYREGASVPGPGHRHGRLGKLVERQRPLRRQRDIATSLALLFLSKGRWPVLMAKVQYRSPGPAAGTGTSTGTATATTSTT